MNAKKTQKLEKRNGNKYAAQGHWGRDHHQFNYVRLDKQVAE